MRETVGENWEASLLLRELLKFHTYWLQQIPTASVAEQELAGKGPAIDFFYFKPLY